MHINSSASSLMSALTQFTSAGTSSSTTAASATSSSSDDTSSWDDTGLNFDQYTQDIAQAQEMLASGGTGVSTTDLASMKKTLSHDIKAITDKLKSDPGTHDGDHTLWNGLNTLITESKAVGQTLKADEGSSSSDTTSAASAVSTGASSLAASIGVDDSTTIGSGPASHGGLHRTASTPIAFASAPFSIDIQA